MNRRDLAALTGAAVLGVTGRTEAQDEPARDLYEWRSYVLDDSQRAPFCRFLAEAALPSAQRLGISPVGLFEARDGQGLVWMLLRHPDLDSVLHYMARTLADTGLQQAGGEVLEAVAAQPAYQTMDSRLLLAIEGMPQLEQPVAGEGRVFQLRIYESPSAKTGFKKIEMFNTAELEIFRDCGLHPVCFGQAIIGDRMPNLTYLLGFESAAAQKAAWDKFRQHPEWLKLRAMPEYADKRIIRKITNLELKPLPGSGI